MRRACGFSLVQCENAEASAGSVAKLDKASVYGPQLLEQLPSSHPEIAGSSPARVVFFFHLLSELVAFEQCSRSFHDGMNDSRRELRMHPRPFARHQFCSASETYELDVV